MSATTMADVEGMTPELLVALGENGVKTRDDLADLAGDELMEFAPAGILTESKANAIIMAARAHWFEDEEVTAEGDAEEAPGGSPRRKPKKESPGETKEEDGKPADG